MSIKTKKKKKTSEEDILQKIDVNAKINIVCPKAGKPVIGTFFDQGIMQQTKWEAVDDGLSGAQTYKWISIKVKCDFCREVHEYALKMNP